MSARLIFFVSLLITGSVAVAIIYRYKKLYGVLPDQGFIWWWILAFDAVVIWIFVPFN